MSNRNIVTTYCFNGQTYFVKMNVANNILELIITDKQTGEDWQCSYEAPYIENLTQKTGNFKQFDVFVNMLKSGLLQTSNSVCLDLMTFDDLDHLRNKGVRGSYTMYHMAQSNSNRRYLILTYSVEFDRIHYPLPLEYCGLPDPRVLQAHIKHLEGEILSLKEQLAKNNSARNRNDVKCSNTLRKRIEVLTLENEELYRENQKLNYMVNKKPRQQIQMLEGAIENLEKSVIAERSTHHKIVEKLKSDKLVLSRELSGLKETEKKLRMQIRRFNHSSEHQPRRMKSDVRIKDDANFLPKISRSGSLDGHMSRSASPRSKRKDSKSYLSRSASDSSIRKRNQLSKFTLNDTIPNLNKPPRPARNISWSRSSSASSYASSASKTADRNLAFFSKSACHEDPQRKYDRPCNLGTVNHKLQALRKIIQDTKYIER